MTTRAHRGRSGVLRAGRTAALAVIAIAVPPVAIVAAGTITLGWWRGLPPRRLARGATWCVPMALTWLAAIALWPPPAAVRPAAAAGPGAGAARLGAWAGALRNRAWALGGGARTPRNATWAAGGGVRIPGTGSGWAPGAGSLRWTTGAGSLRWTPGAGSFGWAQGAGSRAWAPGTGAGSWWFRDVAAPYRAWLAMWHLGAQGHLGAAAVAVAAPAIPLGILAGSLAWARWIFRAETGTGGRSPAAAARFDAGLWRRQVRAARALAAAPGSLPLISPNGSLVTGAVIRSLRHRGGREASIPYDRLRSHQVVIGSTGTGKTTLLLRLWAGFMAGGMRRYAAGEAARPLLVVLDCKGGASSRKVADRARRVLRDAGAATVLTWPDEASLNLWALPPEALITTLMDLIEHGTGGAAFYTDVMESIVSLAVRAPGGPPADSAGFLRRLDADWLSTAYGEEGDAETVAMIRSAKGAVHDVDLRFRALWRRLGAGLDGGGSLGDADAWYCVLEGTSAPAVAEAQARALTDLLASLALDSRREILLAVDEYSAVSRRLPIWRLQERARSLGVAIQVSAQSWEGLAETEDERLRVAATAEGGIWLLRTPRPEPVAALAGTRPVVTSSRRLAGPGEWERTGTSAAEALPVVDGDIVRALDVGQAAYVHRGGVTYVQVKRLVGRQAALGPGSGGDTGSSAAVPAQREPAAERAAGALPDVSEVLDEAFGRRRE